MQPEDWYSRNHQSIYDMARSFQSQNATDAAKNVNDAANKLREIVSTGGQAVQTILHQDWWGLTAQAVQEANSAQFNRVDTNVVAGMHTLANALPPVGMAMDAAKSSIQPPMSAETYRMGKTMGLSDSELQNKVAEDQEHARYQMTSLFSQPAVDASNPVEDIPNPSQNASGGAAPAGTSSGSGGPAGGGSSGKTLDQVGDQIKSLDNVGKTTPAFDRGAG
ncbi:hypothetical protein ABFW00_19045, partial [Mycobacteroides abscessus]